MKNHKLKLLNVAVLACFGLAAQQALATTPSVDISSGGTNTPLKVANEKTAPSTSQALDIKVDAFAGLNTTVAPLTVRFDLIGGAKFSGAPKLHCNLVGSANWISGISTIVGGASNNSVTFQVKTQHNTALSSAPSCVLSAAYTLSGVTPNKTVSAALSYAIGGVTTSHARSGGFITFTKSDAAVFAAGGKVQVDATKSAQKFVVGGSATLQSASLGTVQLSGSTTILGAGGTTALSANNTLSTANITVTGPSLVAGFTSVSGNVYLVATASKSCGTPTISTYSSRSTNSVTFNSVVLAQLSKGYKVCMSVNGKTTIPTGAVTATLTVVPKTGYSVDASATSNALTTVGTNGATMNAYFINASTSPAKTSVIRIINTAGYASTTLTATAYGADGTVLGTSGASLGTVAANGMLTLTSANIESDLGITGLAPTAKYRLVINSDMSSFKVVNFIQDVGTGAIHLAQQQDN